MPQVAAVVGLVMWTATEAPGARGAGPKLSTPPAIVQPGSEPGASMVQARPPLVGRVSLTWRPKTVPAPLLVTVMT